MGTSCKFHVAEVSRASDLGMYDVEPCQATRSWTPQKFVPEATMRIDMLEELAVPRPVYGKWWIRPGEYATSAVSKRRGEGRVDGLELTH